MLKKIALLLLLFAAVGYAASASHLLDGKTFVGESGEKGKDQKQKDTLIFEKGKFHSTACDQYGFTPVSYTAKKEKEGDTITFEAEATSPKEGKNHWKGSVTGDNCEATLVWTKEGQAPIEYSFKGTIQK